MCRAGLREIAVAMGLEDVEDGVLVSISGLNKVERNRGHIQASRIVLNDSYRSG